MIKMMDITPGSASVAGARVALYAAGGSTLVSCARYAERSGLRVVTMIEKHEVSSGLGGSRLDALVGRLDDGEFEVIVADAGGGRVVTIAGVSLGSEQSAAVLDRDEIADSASHEEVARIPAEGLPLRCAIYVRTASPSQATPHPLADQWKACETYAAEQGWETVGVYKDNANSGNKWSRSSFNLMMSEAARGAFDVVLVRDLARLSRDASHLHRLLAELKAVGVAVHTVNGGERVAWQPSVWRFMVMHSIREATAQKRLGRDRKLRSSRTQTTDTKVVL